MALQIKAAEKEINKRNVKLGVGGRETEDNQQARLIFEEGTLAQTEAPVQFKNTDDLEDRDRESIQIALKRYSKAIKLLFNKYSKN